MARRYRTRRQRTVDQNASKDVTGSAPKRRDGGSCYDVGHQLGT
jgi:hypothetical protein